MFYPIDGLVLFAGGVIPRSGARWGLVTIGTFLSLSALVFFPQMVAATWTVVVFSLLYFVRFQKISTLPAVFLGTLVVWWLLARQSLSTFPDYLRTSIEITGSYADAMPQEGPSLEIWLALLIFAVGLVAVTLLANLSLAAQPRKNHSTRIEYALQLPVLQAQRLVDLTGFNGTLRSQLGPASFLEILKRYEYLESRGKLAVLRRGSARPFRRLAAFEASAEPGQWVSTAESGTAEPIWVEVDAHATLRGKPAGAAFKTPPLVLGLQFLDGSARTYRLAAHVAQAGFWLSPTIENSRQFVGFMRDGVKGITNDRIVSSLRIRESSGHTSWAWRDFRIRGWHLTRSEGRRGGGVSP